MLLDRSEVCVVYDLIVIQRLLSRLLDRGVFNSKSRLVDLGLFLLLYRSRSSLDLRLFPLLDRSGSSLSLGLFLLLDRSGSSLYLRLLLLLDGSGSSLDLLSRES